MTEPNPLTETFDPIDVEGYDEEVEKAKPKPAEDGKYLLEIIERRLAKVKKEDSPNYKKPLVSFICAIIEDDNPDNNGKRMFSRGFVLAPGFAMKYFLDFAETVSPKVKWKKGTRLLHEDGSSEILDAFIGTKFLADVSKDIDAETSEPTGYNSMDATYSIS